jgi:hypothetical protein
VIRFVSIESADSCVCSLSILSGSISSRLLIVSLNISLSYYDYNDKHSNAWNKLKREIDYLNPKHCFQIWILEFIYDINTQQMFRSFDRKFE